MGILGSVPDTDWNPPIESVLPDECASIALCALETSRLPPHEPSGDLRAIDAQIDKGHELNPVVLSHEVATYFLQGAGESVHSIGRLTDQHPPVTSLSALSRVACEYAAYAWWLSDPQEDPAIRASKVIGISYASVMDKGTDPRYTTMRKKIEGWRSTAQKHKASKPDPAKILKEMLDSAYADDYTDQSRIIHPDLITMIDVMTAQNEGKPWNRQRAWNHSMCAMYATLIATERVATLRDANPDHIDQIAQIKQRFYEVAGLTDT
ncbi:hypothetical protein GOOTI_025_00110 [Gordonia otitidis NBRC 100426]|uniref:Uncharacterized protein n=1 Tax=Gordonia otitidis (strain DSM 44809 / CCUG 52243 / JCM 12355 / NBRC 100426 / IFM 10032) TaxID=1108044 RepID=H5TGX3_GORO1|nr:hypothetical protein GOOTI_025_00110 [Gordonia otitidis NBRC 100426]